MSGSKCIFKSNTDNTTNASQHVRNKILNHAIRCALKELMVSTYSEYRKQW